MLTLQADELSTYRHPLRWTQTKATRPVRFRLDSDGCSLAVDLPGPAYLADFVIISPAAQRRGSAIISQGEPVDLLALASALREQLAALPACPGEGVSHRDLRLAAATDSDRVFGYCMDVIRALRATLPLEQQPVRPRGPRKTDAENCRNYRERLKAAEKASAAAWLRSWLLDDEDPPEPGSTVQGRALYEQASEVLDMWAEDEEPIDEADPDSPPVRVPRPINFYAAADEVLGLRKRTKHGIAYTVPEEDMNNLLLTREEILAAVVDRVINDAKNASRIDSHLAPVTPLRSVSC